MDKSEEWRDIEGYEGYYQVSDLGRVKSLARIVERGSGLYRVSDRILRPVLNGGPSGGRRLGVALHGSDGKQIVCKIHKLVLEAFVGPRPDNLDGCHNDGDPTNNRLDNLRWDTKSSNQNDRILHGTYQYGSQNTHSKLIESQVLVIRELAGSVSQRDLAKQFNVSDSIISTIVNRKSWTHI